MNSSAKPTKQCVQRLQKELRNLQKEPSSYFVAAPDPRNILIWCVRIIGPANTCYAGGYYISEIRFPSDYPFRPPSIKMCTPNGRFKTDTAICLSNSSFHPEEWSPMWSVSTIITGMISFFVSDESAMGTMKASEAERRRYAKESRSYNVKRLAPFFKRSLPETFAEDSKFLEEEENQQKHSSADENLCSEASSVEKDFKLPKADTLYSLGGKLGVSLKNHQHIESTMPSVSSNNDPLITSLHPPSSQPSLKMSKQPSLCMVLLSLRGLSAVTVVLAAVVGLFYCIHS